jgi:hypothetical protein
MSVPHARADLSRWETIRPERTVLGVVRTLTSTVRLLDVLSVFRADFRVRTLFTVDTTSEFSRGAAETLAAVGAIVLPWDEARRRDVDLVLTASENVKLARVNAPILVLPHGIGFHRLVPDSENDGTRLSGLVPLERLRDNQMWMVVSHDGQREQIRADFPEAAARCLVVGDLTYDRLVASLPLREEYRSGLGIGDGQRLIVLTSTWGEGSLFDRWRDLPAQLLGNLPADEYQVALVLHPNIWSRYGDNQVQRLWLDNAMDAGLLLIPPTTGWQAALAAADLVIGDQGSVTLYAAALDRPVMLGAIGTTVVPGTPPERLSLMAERLDPGLPLREQVEAGIGRHRDGMFGPLAADMFSSVGDSARALRALCYDRLRLAPPSGRPLIRAFPPPSPSARTVGSHVVYSAYSEAGATGGPGAGGVAEAGGVAGAGGADGTKRSVTVWRFPAAVGGLGMSGRGIYRHVCAAYDDPDRELPGNASAVVRRTLASPAAASAWLARALELYPGSLIAGAAVRGGCLAGLRNGSRFLVTVDADYGVTFSGDGEAMPSANAGATPGADPGLSLSALYTCLRAGRLEPGPLLVRAGAITARFTVSAWG